MRSRTARRVDRGQSELIGTVLLLGIVLIGSGAAVVFGTTALEAARDDSRASSVEHAMTQFDSKAAMVALGSSNAQEVRLAASGGGTYGVNDDDGWIRVSHVNYSPSGSTEVLTNTTLGAVVYEDGDTTIAYQGGGVWRGTGNESRMISPPEFHYRGSTLTLPIIAVNGSDSIAGARVAGVGIQERSKRVFPNRSAPDYGNASYENPVDTGNVAVTVHSDHYVAWADYFEERTAGDVSLDHENSTATVTLVADRAGGDFNMPGEGNAIAIRGMENGHKLTDFSISLQVSKWNNIHWSFYESQGNEEFEIHLASSSGNNCNNVDRIDVSVYYYNGTTDRYQGWQNQSVRVDSDPDADFTKDCSSGTLTADFLGNTTMNYTDISTTGNDNKWYYGESIDSRSPAPTVRFDQHTEDSEGDRNGVYNDTDPDETDELGFVVSHYIARLGPSVDLRVTEGPSQGGGNSDSVDESSSSGLIDYDRSGSSGFLTFLHVTENEIQVDID